MMKQNGGDMMLPPPMDRTDLNVLVQKMKQMVPYYTPEWRFNPDDPDPGTALFYLFADMYLENVKRFNQVPMKNFIAFLNMLDISRQTAKPANAYLTFQLSEGTTETVYVPTGTPAVAIGDNGDNIVFETAAGIMVTPAQLSSVINTSGSRDRIVIAAEYGSSVKAGEQEPYTLFDCTSGNDLQSHEWLIGQSDLLHLTHPARIELFVENKAGRFMEPIMAAKLANPNLVEWLYPSQGEWVPFDEVTAAGNRIILKKLRLTPLDLTEQHELESRFIKCRVKPLQIDELAARGGGIELEAVKLRCAYEEPLEGGGIAPDLLFYNDVELAKQIFYPFGEQFAPYGVFYISSQEVFGKKRAKLTLSIDLRCELNRVYPDATQPIEWKLIMKESAVKPPEPKEISIIRVAWEYWNGTTWSRLNTVRTDDELFYRPSKEGAIRKRMRVDCPSDMTETQVNGEWGYWIRARIMNVEDVYNYNSLYMTPIIDKLELAYDHEDVLNEPDYQLTSNNAELLRWTGAASLTDSYKPFVPLACKNPAVYFGFEEPPVRGPISMYMSLLPQTYTEKQVPIIEWEYYGVTAGKGDWTSLKVVDETNGFTVGGTLQFAGPSQIARCGMFGRSLYWIRAVNRDNKFEDYLLNVPLPTVKGIHMNTVKVVQQETISGEQPDRREGEGYDDYILSSFPVISEQVWVDETGHISEEELALLPSDWVEAVRDSEGHLQRCWIRWEHTDHFYESESKDRHYAIQRSSGIITFGNGKNGKKPPNAGRDKVKVNYKIGGGKAGNVGAMQINALQNSLAFVKAVYNPEAAGGGCDMETTSEAITRGPQTIKHRDRAVTVEDFEWLTRQADTNIGKVKCLPNYNSRVEKEIGCITMVVLPKGGDAGSTFPMLKRNIENYLLERSASSVAFPERIKVIEPAFIEICVFADLVVKSMEHIVAVEMESLAKLKMFLDPFAGNFDGKGWSIGQHIHSSVFYALLKSVGKVNHVEQLTMSLFKIEQERRMEISQEQFESLPHGIVVCGSHSITVNCL
jgi:hypothetical protein